MIKRCIRKKALFSGLFFLTLFGTSIDLAAQTSPPPRCSGFGDLESIFLTTWSSGLGPWTAGTHDIANPPTFDTADWSVVGGLPDGRPGTAAFVANLDAGDCGANDQAGALTLDSPPIVIPASTEVPRISVDHWFETEYGWDGGNIKISVNGGPFEVVPASAIEYGQHNDTLFPAVDEFGVDNNTNPLAGEDAFTGTIDDGLAGSWVQTRINLEGIAGVGDTIELRFDFGIDSCDGAIGWYVDDVEVYRCEAELPPSDCGNGMLDAGEQCDDGNAFVGDGCSNSCQIEDGWQCTAPTPAGTIADPSFEAGRPNPSWDETSNNFLGSPICDAASCNTGGGSGPSDGTYWAWLGGVLESSESSVAQSIVIPSSASLLTFDLEIPVCDSSSDYFEVLIDGNQELLIDGADARCGNTGYASQTVDIRSYADGASHDLEFHSETFSDNGGVSNFFIDVVAMPGNPSACTPLGPSLTLNIIVINNDGGSAGPSAWTLSADGPSPFSGRGPSVSSAEGFQPGTYDLSASGGPAGYTAGDWSCSGGTQADADTIELGQGESATCTIAFDDVSSSFRINAGHSGAWFNPETAGQGLLLDVEPSERFMFIAWFSYTDDASDHPFEQRWLTAQGSYSGNSATLVLSETLGGKFDDPQAVTTTPIGQLTVSFNDCNQGQATYSIDSEELQGQFPLTRAIPGSGDTCQQLDMNSTRAVDINAGMDGAWFDPATSGQGYLIDSYPNTDDGNFMFVAWFTYGDDTASGQRWLTAQGGFEGSVAELVISETTNGSFDDPRPPTTLPVGTMNIDFSDCSNALLSYSLPDDEAEGEVAIQRAVPASKALCENISGTD